MDQHPIPRQITTFEFKLIGFLTIKQFIYLVVFFPFGFVVYSLFPIPLLNILLGVLTGCIGLAFAFLPVNDRPLEVWIRNFFKRLTSPTQYIFHKKNAPLYFLQDLVFLSDPHRVMTHIESQKKLAQYLAAKNPAPAANTRKQTILNLFQTASLPNKKTVSPPLKPSTLPLPADLSNAALAKSGARKPFFTGVVKNHKLIPLPGLLIYVKDDQNKVLRLLKTNPHGVFATFNPLPATEYSFEIKDPNSSYLFDTMKIKVEKQNEKPIEIFSKELL